MENKNCKLCSIEKPLSLFDCYSGKYRAYCTDCRREKDKVTAEKRRRAKGVERVKGTPAVCVSCGSDYTKNSVRSMRCAPCAKQVVLERARIASLAKARSKGFRVIGTQQECSNCKTSFVLDQPKAKYCLPCRELQKKNAIPAYKEKKQAYKQKYFANPENARKALDAANKWRRDRIKSDPIYALIGRCRARINMAFRKAGYTKRSRTHEILGCSWDFLMGYIEARFQPGMTWENRSLWHIDHIIPLASAKTEEDVVRLSHYTNLQPLWASDNLAKSDKMPIPNDNQPA